MKLFVCISLLFLETMIMAQTGDLPSKVDNAFKEKYQNAQNMEWFDNNDTIIIDFDLGREYFKVLFSKEGEWIETCRRIENESFPLKIVKVITSKYPAIQLINGDFVENKKSGKFYRFFGYVAETDYTINISPDGKILNPMN